ncbi:MAG TPA: hypothetical protein VM390_07790, partial [Acidimicrobiales bacterium]|nr:hypothetical protein [Acidimicrobiales bacterium]
EALAADGHARAKALAAWKERVIAGWGDVRVEALDGEDGVTDLGGERVVTAAVSLGRLSPADVAVELVHGSVGATDELTATGVVGMRHDGEDGGRHRYVGAFTCERAGRYGFTVRVVPSHPDLLTHAELGRVIWA